jgi:hypothetical protein
MRKLLLGTTALAAAATLSANAALADVSISGYYEWKYQSTSSDITKNDGTTFGSDSEIAFKFSNKTDSGLDLGLTVEMFSDGDEANNTDEASLSIAGGFGKLVLGQNDGVGDNYGVASSDLPAEEIVAGSGTTSGLTIYNADINGLSGDANKISYHLPAMGGLSAGVSFMNSGAAGSKDSTEFGAQYAMDAGGASVTIGFASGTTEAASQDTDSQVMGIKVNSGNITAVVSQSSYESAAVAAANGVFTQVTTVKTAAVSAVGKADEESTGAAVSFKVNDGMTITAHTVETDDSGSKEEYTNSGIEVAYTIASGLTAYLNVEDYEYKAGTSGKTADSGTASKLTIKATF